MEAARDFTLQVTQLEGPICSLAHRQVRLGPWSVMTAKLVPGEPRTWEVTFGFWCDGDDASHATVRIKGTARTLVVLDHGAHVASWSETSSSPLSLIELLIWLLVSVMIGTVAGTVILFGTLGYKLLRLLGFLSEFSVNSESLTRLIEWCFKVLWRLFIPVSLVLSVVAGGAVEYFLFHSVPGGAVGLFLAWRIAAALLKRIKRLQKIGTWFAKNDGRTRHRPGAVLVFLGLAAVGIYAMEVIAQLSTAEVTGRSILGAVVGLLTCGILGRMWGPLFMGGARHSATVGAGSGAVVGAISGAQIILPEWWIVAVFAGAEFGARIDREESES